ncbi:hypothetical protein GX865_02870 [Candidatus Saccharibacteria bacterium]|jgi:hypothetical protein|nr:hypothetical protein [Candidatus Saccharibacteria bacterium]
MEYFIPFSIIALAAAVHASFQLSISTLTLMSGHSLGKKQSQSRLLRLISGFLLGVAGMTALLFVALVYAIEFWLENGSVPPVLWAALSGVLFGLGVAVWLFYFKKGSGTMLWLPRGVALYLAERSKRSKSTSEALALGMASVTGELLFIIAPLGVAAMITVTLPPLLQVAALLMYVPISITTLLIVAALVGSGHKISQIQRWREANKRFLQFIAGTSLLVLGFYLYVNEVLLVGV